MSGFPVILFAVIAASTSASDLDRESLVAALEGVEAGNRAHIAALGVEVGGYNWFQDFRLGKGHGAVVLSRNLGGEIFLFTGSRLVGRKSLHEPLAVQARDLDGDGVMELVLESLDVRGTGVLEIAYHIYARDGSQLIDAWTRPASW